MTEARVAVSPPRNPTDPPSVEELAAARDLVRLPGQLADFARIRRAADPRVAAESRLVIGPWAHAETVTYPDGATPRNFRLECLAPAPLDFRCEMRGLFFEPTPKVSDALFEGEGSRVGVVFEQ